MNEVTEVVAEVTPEVVVPEKKWYELIDIKGILRAVYSGVRGLIAKKVLESESKWDDAALQAVDLLVETFLGEDKK